MARTTKLDNWHRFIDGEQKQAREMSYDDLLDGVVRIKNMDYISPEINIRYRVYEQEINMRRYLIGANLV